MPESNPVKHARPRHEGIMESETSRGYEMKNEKFDGKIENAYGNKLDTPLSYDANFDAFENISEVRSANEYPSDTEIVDFLNAKRKANARQKAMQAALDAAGIVKPTLENDDQLKLKKMYEIFIAAKKTHKEARDLASNSLGIAWADGKE